MKLDTLVLTLLGLGFQTVSSRVIGESPTWVSTVPIHARDNSTKIPFGEIIRGCTNDRQIAITLDDGPSQHTQQILDEFAKYKEDGFKATFFITGNNFCPITEPQCANILQKVHQAGHQIASHTWTHLDLDTIGHEARVEQMMLNKQALATALNMGGKTPTYMRPPFGSCYDGSGCLSDMGAMGYHVIDWNIDSLDWMYCASEWDCAQSVAVFDEQFDAGAKAKIGFNVLSHDIKEFTASILLPHMLKRAKQAGYKVVTVGECLNDPKENWYKRW